MLTELNLHINSIRYWLPLVGDHVLRNTSVTVLTRIFTDRAVADINSIIRQQRALREETRSAGPMNAIQAAGHQAAIEDGVLKTPSGISAENEAENSQTNLRRGKWTPEEEEYSSRIIAEFKNGTLPLTDGTTLRTFLSKLLNCDPVSSTERGNVINCV